MAMQGFSCEAPDSQRAEHGRGARWNALVGMGWWRHIFFSVLLARAAALNFH